MIIKTPKGYQVQIGNTVYSEVYKTREEALARMLTLMKQKNMMKQSGSMMDSLPTK